MHSPWDGQLKNLYLIPGMGMRFSSSDCVDLLEPTQPASVDTGVSVPEGKAGGV
jgi:hypothetical protein